MSEAMPLSGVRVIDLSSSTSGPFCTRILADYGADVIKIEPPEGDPGRTLGPFYRDEPGLERSGLFLFLNTSKRSVVLDLSSVRGRDTLRRLIRTADVVVENFRPGTLEGMDLGYDALKKLNPRIVLTSISNFGQTGPHRDWQGVDLTLYAAGGAMLACGVAGEAPLKVAGRQTGFYAGMVAALATITSLRAAERTGVGAHLDVSIHETAAHSIDFRLARLMLYQLTGRYSGRPEVGSAIGGGVVPCADGWFMLAGGPKRLESITRLIGRPDLLERPEFATVASRAKPGRAELFLSELLPWTMERTKAEILAACLELGVIGAPVNTVQDLLTDANFVAREFFQTIDHPTTGPLQYPGFHFRLRSGAGLPARRRAPLLGEHTAEVELALEMSEQCAPESDGARLATSPSELPLDGVRILDFTVVLAGPYATMHLADWGAEVIRVESLQHFGASTRGQMARPPEEMVAAMMAAPGGGGYSDWPLGSRPWNRSAAFNAHARGKKSMTVDLTRPEGQAILERLVARADVVIENNLPDNVEKLGLTWERLSQINPRLVMVRMPGFGIDGPYRSLRSLGHLMEAVAGHPVIRTYPDRSMESIPVGVPSDAAAGVMGAFAVLAGLRYRDLNGRGVLIEQSTAENFVPLIGDFVMDFTMNQRLWSQMGNSDTEMAPHNVYRCREADEWVAIAVRDESDWARFCTAIGREELAGRADLATSVGRRAARKELDDCIGEWARGRAARWIVEHLQIAGIPAATVVTEPELFSDRHLWDRDFFQDVEHPETGRQLNVRTAWMADGMRPAIRRHAPLLGQDNGFVYREVLGLSDEEIQRLVDEHHIGMDYVEGVP